MDEYMAIIKMFGGNFAPRNWMFCNGQLLPISQHTALFSLLGTTYGGDGRTTFGLPDLRGRVPVGFGNGPGLTSWSLGEKAGQENVNLSVQQIPSHNHQAAGNPGLSVEIKANSSKGSTEKPGNNYFAQSVKPAGRGETDPIYTYSGSEDGTTINGVSINGSVANTGGSQSHPNMQPLIAMNYIICVQGIFPPRS